MIRMPSNTLPLEQRREPQPGGDLALRNHLVAAFRLINDEFTDLQNKK
jgi:hypothetical protein